MGQKGLQEGDIPLSDSLGLAKSIGLFNNPIPVYRPLQKIKKWHLDVRNDI